MGKKEKNLEPSEGQEVKNCIFTKLRELAKKRREKFRKNNEWTDSSFFDFHQIQDLTGW